MFSFLCYKSILSIQERLNKIITYSGVKPNSFAEEIGIYPQRLGNYLRGRTPDLETLDKILAAYPEIDARWLLTGEGFMTAAEETTENILKELEDKDRKYNTVSPIQPGFAIKGRIREILARNNYDPETFSSESKISKSSLQSQIEGKATLTVDLIRAITARFPAYPYQWILTGDKEAEKESETNRALLEKLEAANKEIARLNKEIGKLESKLGK
ncbi:MAG: helix-turn-helix domain-containing protein [Tannerellaceae bacterium]|nr:helix-turn-helix domain-containing protein [Tannerellaceae bacterium]